MISESKCSCLRPQNICIFFWIVLKFKILHSFHRSKIGGLRNKTKSVFPIFEPTGQLHCILNLYCDKRSTIVSEPHPSKES